MSSIPKTTAALPVDIEAEKRVLGILVKHPQELDNVVEKLRPEHFYYPEHRKIYEAIWNLYTESGRVTYTQLYNHLRKTKAFANPAEVLMSLTESIVAVSELEPSVEVLRLKTGLRRILEASWAIESLVINEEGQDLSEIQARAQELIFAATENSADGETDVKSLLEVLSKCYTKLVERRQGLKSAYGLSVQFPSVDAMTTGFKKKDLIILAARPSMGKTAFALNMVVNVAKRNVPTLIFSLEMDDEQIGDRIVLSEFFRCKAEGEAEITAAEYQVRLTDQQFAMAQSVFNELYQLPITIVDRRGLTCAEIRALARKVKASQPDLGLVVIDYLQLIRPPGNAAGRNWALVVGEMVRELRDLAGELDVPIILISQLNRGVENRVDKRPLMSDLRDSGNIEEFADVVMFLYRHDYYHPEEAEAEGTQGEVEVIFAKQRKGPTGTVKLKFVKEYTRFIDEYVQ
ncbi:MAG: replicative DNA helicase [Limnochordia bacterium]|mgnify:FL=1|nr:replicative DNA helicase [Bacillota bacterium]NLH30531.1 replicative DNA helicase [Bacillota bacterium]HPT92584.1 replicative DNA helicase [Limnochordia bacterium]